MGEALYEGAEAVYGKLSLRAYAPVGGHEDLLPYLVRRLLENGANTSFVHALLDDDVPPELVVGDPVSALEAAPDRHPRIPAPLDLYGEGRVNSRGRDLSVAKERACMTEALKALDAERLVAAPATSKAQEYLSSRPKSRDPGVQVASLALGPGSAAPSGMTIGAGAFGESVTDPADRTITVGHVHEASTADVDDAFARARAAQPRWDALGGAGRGKVLRRMADALEGERDRFCALAVREAGKSWSDAIGEVREAVDFLRYYALHAERLFAGPTTLTGPVGEHNTLELAGRGVFVCISPWNFPLAIFTGQIAAALAAGNAVLAKPAEQTPLIAAEAVRLFHRAGLEPDLLHLLPGRGETVGVALVAYPGIAGVAFTGGTETAWAINKTLAARRGPIVPFIAETGGLNGMFVDTTALREQVIDDVVVSAFNSAGQRCSALRLLYLPRDTADADHRGDQGGHGRPGGLRPGRLHHRRRPGDRRRRAAGA